MLKFASFEVLSAELAGNRSYRRAKAQEWHLSPSLIRTAHRAVFDYEPRPGYLYVRSRAISSRCNDNWDEFPAEEIAKSWRTFIGKPVFVNHANDNHRRARGVIINAALHRDAYRDGTPDVWVEVLHEIDANAYPKLAQAILSGEIDKTSMGCDVDHSICSACGNVATQPLEYCRHIPAMKGQQIVRRNAKSGRSEVDLIREICYGLRFFENSHLVEDPADPTAFHLDVDARGLGVTAARRPPKVRSPQIPLDLPTNMLHWAAYGPGQEFVPEAPWTHAGDDTKAPVHPGLGGHGPKPDYEDYDPAQDDENALGAQEHLRLLLDKPKMPQHRMNMLRWSGIEPDFLHQTRSREFYPPNADYFNADDLKVPEHRLDPDSSGYAEQGPYEAPTAEERQRHPHRLNMLRWSTNRDMYGENPPDDECPHCGDKRIEVSEEGDAHGPFYVCHGCGASGHPDELGEHLDRKRRWSEDNVDAPAGTRNPYEHNAKLAGDNQSDYARQSHPFEANEGSDKCRYCNGYSDARVHQAHQSKLGYGDIKAPAEVDTLREDICPVCGETDSYNGEQCMVCGFVKPPSMFMDPDINVAQQVNLRQDQTEMAQQGAEGDVGGDLQCPVCGQTFASAEEMDAAGDPHLAPAAQTEVDVPPEEALAGVPPKDGGAPTEMDRMQGPNPDPDVDPDSASRANQEHTDDLAQDGGDAKPDSHAQDVIGEDEDEEGDVDPTEDNGANPPGQGKPQTSSPDGQTNPEDTSLADQGLQESDPGLAEAEMGKEDAESRTGYSEGDICPNCGQGVLEAAEEVSAAQGAAQAPPGAPGEDPDDEGAFPPPEPGEDAGGEVAGKDSGPDTNGPTNEEDQVEGGPPQDNEEDTDEDEDGEDGPPSKKKKPVTSALGRPSYLEGEPVEMAPRPQNGRRTAAAPNPAPNPAARQRSALLTALNAQAGLIRTQASTIARLEAARDADGVRFLTLERQMAAVASLAGIDEVRTIGIEGNRHYAALVRQADERNPAQPVPEPADEAPYETSAQAAQPNGRDDPTQLGASPITDVSADASIAVDEPYGEVANEPLNLNESDVTAPTPGTHPGDQTPFSTIPVEVRVGNPDDPNPAFGWNMGQPPATGGSVGTSGGTNPGGFRAARAEVDPNRPFHAMRLAQLRIQAGIAPTNDMVTLGYQIASNDTLTVEAMHAESKTLASVLQVNASRRPVQAPADPQQRVAARHLVPQTSGDPTMRTTPSLAALASADPGAGPGAALARHGSLLAVDEAEILFD